MHLGLAEHPQVSACIDEVNVSPFFTEGISVYTNKNERQSEKDISHLALFRCITSLNKKENCLAYGMHSVINSPEDAQKFVTYVQTYYPDVKIIIMKRLNVIARLASEIQAMLTGVYLSFDKTDKIANLGIDDNLLYDSITTSIRIMKILERLCNTHETLDCIYEYDIEKENLRGL